ncbi:MAG: hypothetical protein D6714_19950, partial [Bacteroidetes bacterium]
KDVTTTTRKHAWVWGLVGNGERTSVGTDNFSKTSWGIGPKIEWFPSDRFSVGLSAIFSLKNYFAGTGEYIPPKGFWTRKIPPQSTDGHCLILELPVEGHYFPKGRTRTGFFAGAGVNSFILLRENYTYHYDLPDPDLIRNWHTANQNQHWFGIAQFSIGRQFVYPNQKSMRLSTFLQIPMTGIGHGQVKLWSAGLQWEILFHPKN